MSLYALTAQAECDFFVLRRPNVDEWIAAIDPVLLSAGECCIGNDRIDDITLGENELRITTSYSVRGCVQTNDLRLPVYILKADEPVRAAYRYRINKELGEAKRELATSQRIAAEWAGKVAFLEKEVDTFTQQDNEGKSES